MHLGICNQGNCMQLSQSTSMRQEMRQLLTPRMIQSMEILQLPLMAVEERIEQELQANPVLELKENGVEAEVTLDVIPDGPDAAQRDDFSEDERPMVVQENSDQAADFDRLTKIGEYLENEEFFTNGSNRQSSSFDGERDKKLDAMNNTAARGITLADHLMNQWAFIEAPAGIKKAGEALINYVDIEGYVRVELEAIQTESKTPLLISDLQAALGLLQTLDPPGVGARNLQECLL